jgi:hypothetical protein
MFKTERKPHKRKYQSEESANNEKGEGEQLSTVQYHHHKQHALEEPVAKTAQPKKTK